MLCVPCFVYEFVNLVFGQLIVSKMLGGGVRVHAHDSVFAWKDSQNAYDLAAEQHAPQLVGWLRPIGH